MQHTLVPTLLIVELQDAAFKGFTNLLITVSKLPHPSCLSSWRATSVGVCDNRTSDVAATEIFRCNSEPRIMIALWAAMRKPLFSYRKFFAEVVRDLSR